MPVPREGHEDVGNDQEDDGCHDIRIRVLVSFQNEAWPIGDIP